MSTAASWDNYEPLCLHDSSLSLSTHSVLASDIGDPQLGYEMFRKACLIDLDNANSHSSDAGIHIGSAHFKGTAGYPCSVRF